MKISDTDWERQQTRSLLFQFCSIAVVVPLLAVIFVATYFSIINESLNRGEWKTVVFCVWLGTMLVLFWKAVQSLAGPRRFLRLWQHSEEDTKKTKGQVLSRTAGRWEQSNTNLIIKELFGVVVAVPLLAFAMIWFYFHFLEQTLEKGDWKTGVFCIWLGTLVCLIRIAKKAIRNKIL